jgi:hypothetical protein
MRPISKGEISKPAEITMSKQGVDRKITNLARGLVA